MTSILETLNWANLENISEPMTPLQIKTSALVLTKDGVGSIICPKCNTLNLVRDGIFQCYCGFTTNIISCACGCGQPLLDRNIWGRMREYVSGHNGRLDKSSGWRVGRIKCGNYYLVFRPKHHEADKRATYQNTESFTKIITSVVYFHGQKYIISIIMDITMISPILSRL